MANSSQPSNLSGPAQLYERLRRQLDRCASRLPSRSASEEFVAEWGQEVVDALVST